ncbi:MAG TPA: endonuclease NucS domain-containing protein [Terriglobia bacterium]|nr:endonuclease NucS domain-containing protein [Terriglobia bacterium]
MLNRLEDKIRDHLAEHLNILEDGLALIDKEYPLPSPIGAGGRIDLLARDIFGHVVVIEIKRSDQAARQALNEIHKYTALFRIRAGLDESKIRLMVVSAEWHELLLPLSEFAAVTPYPVEGINISALPDGTVTTVSKVKLVKRGSALNISQAQCIYLYAKAADRDATTPRIVAALEGAGVQDFAILHCDYAGTSARFIQPHANYVIFSSPLENLGTKEAAELKARIDWEDGLDLPEENFLAYINNNELGDSVETGYPEKLTNLRKEWSVSVSVRHGRFGRIESVLADEEIVQLAQAIEGGSPIYLHKTTSPRFASTWAQCKEHVNIVLAGNSVWAADVPEYLKEIEATAPEATVVVSLYNPTNLFMSLYNIAWKEDYSLCPNFEIVVDERSTGRVRVLVGIVAWTGEHIRETPVRLMEEIYGGVFEWMTYVTTHGTRDFEDTALAAHHLQVLTVEWEFKGGEELGPILVTWGDGGLLRSKQDQQQFQPLKSFAAAHMDYLSALKHHLEDHITGLPGSLPGQPA